MPKCVERWREVSEFPSYSVSNLGRVRGLYGKILSPRVHKHKNGYVTCLTVVLYVAGKRHVRLISGLVLEAFRERRPPGKECCHEDGDPTNNVLKKLRWDTHQSNMQDCISHGKFHYEAGRLKGSDHPRAKLSESLVIQARQLRKKGLVYREIKEQLKASASWQTLAKAIRGQKWQHVANV